jgi:adenylosuccinate lyase
MDDKGISRLSGFSTTALPPPENFHGPVGTNANFKPMDEDGDSDENGNLEFDQDVRQQVQQLSRDICKEFAQSFSDIDS